MSDSADGAAEQQETEAEQGPPPKDPLKSFRGIMAGALIMEAITVGLAVPVVAQLGGGVTSAQGWLTIAVAVAHLAACGLLRFDWIRLVILGLQLVLIGFFVSLVAIGVIGVLFLGVWLYLFWLRHDVAKRMAAGTLPSQQTS
ncbi:DUF4233 domain-containing protein [Haloechinothrix salitolerans]|uniref:DUF4233 domain-containing protein n=1 Tax=Haloechinothrix salitolerans TaxID=926830 RepID=A0ABW2C5H3_9PSEU